MFWKFLEHYTAVGDQLSPGHYGPHLPPNSDKLSPSLSNLVAVYRPPWPISPQQTGSVLKPTNSQLCKLHEHYIDLPPPTEDFCAQLPWALVGNRRCNLSDTHGYLFHSKRLPGLGLIKRAIEGFAAYWSPYARFLVSDENGRVIGLSTNYNLVFGDIFAEEKGLNSRREVGMWRAEEFTCSDKIDGDCSMIVLYCTNVKLKTLEIQLGFTESDMSSFLQKSLKDKKQANEDILCYLELLGTCYAQISDERVWCQERDERMGRGVFDVEGGIRIAPDDFFDVDALAERHKSRIPLGRKMQGGARVRERKKKGGRGKR